MLETPRLATCTRAVEQRSLIVYITDYTTTH